MSDKTSELRYILETAIKVEENGYATFKRLSDNSQNETGKKMFARLAKDELEHKEMLERQLKTLDEYGRINKIEIPESAVEKLLPAIREKQKRTKGESGLGEVDALNTALDLERKTAQFFRDKAEEIDSEEVKEMFLRLAEWEDSHLELIQAELDYVKNTGFWFGTPEFKMDGMF